MIIYVGVDMPRNPTTLDTMSREIHYPTTVESLVEGFTIIDRDTHRRVKIDRVYQLANGQWFVRDNTGMPGIVVNAHTLFTVVSDN